MHDPLHTYRQIRGIELDERAGEGSTTGKVIAMAARAGGHIVHEVAPARDEGTLYLLLRAGLAVPCQESQRYEGADEHRAEEPRRQPQERLWGRLGED